MWLRILFFTSDIDYSNRLKKYWEKNYDDKIDLDMVDNESAFDRAADQQEYDVILLDEAFQNKKENCGRKTTCIVLCQHLYDGMDDRIYLLKYQRADMIYKKLLSAYSAGKEVKIINPKSINSNKNKIRVFMSSAGGSGTTSVAKAYAAKQAWDKKVLFLETGVLSIGSDKCEGAGGWTDVLIALKSKRNILQYRLESSIQVTENRYHTLASCDSVVDMLEITADNMRRLLEEICALDTFDEIIIDIGSEISEKGIAIMEKADSIIHVWENTEINSLKLRRYLAVLKGIEDRDHIKVSRKILLFQNRIHGNRSKSKQVENLPVTKWIPEIQAESHAELINGLSQLEVFEDLETIYG